MNKKSFFEQFELEIEILPYGVDELGVRIALPKDAEQICWDFLETNKERINLKEIIKLSDEFSFVSESNFKFKLKRRVTETRSKQ